jgi:hypothetical protein
MALMNEQVGLSSLAAVGNTVHCKSSLQRNVLVMPVTLMPIFRVKIMQFASSQNIACSNLTVRNDFERALVGVDVGWAWGCIEGIELGNSEGAIVGEVEGDVVGYSLGSVEGKLVGFE